MQPFNDYIPAGRMPFAVKLAEVKETDHVLDVGCFTGQLERHFLRGRCSRYSGVDVNEDAIKYARRQAGENADFQLAQSEKLPFADASFDVLFCLDVFEHVADEAKTVAEFKRVLKPGGTLILSVPHDYLNFLDPDELTRGMRNLVRKYIKRAPLLDHPKHRHYSEQDLRKLFSGFEITTSHKSGTPLFWMFAMGYTAFGIPETIVSPLRNATRTLENWDYATPLRNGFNIMIKARRS